MVITSLDNNKIKFVNKLHLKKHRDEEKLFIVEGDHLTLEAYKCGYLKEVFILEDSKYTFDDTVVVNYVTNEVMKKISEQVTPSDIIGICNYIENNIDKGKNLVLLDQVQDPGNLGTILRSAAAFNYDVVIGDNSVDVYNSKTVRSTEGMIFHTRFVKANLVDFIENNDSYDFLIADMNKGVSVKNINKDKKIGIIMGNEGNGVSDDVRHACYNYVHINQSSNVESLNVGVAASILMYELGDIDE